MRVRMYVYIYIYMGRARPPNETPAVQLWRAATCFQRALTAHRRQLHVEAVWTYLYLKEAC